MRRGGIVLVLLLPRRVLLRDVAPESRNTFGFAGTLR